jgi:fatty-acyl-CoA synthase
MQTFADLVLARSDDDHPGLVAGDDTFTWSQVVQAARARASLLRQYAASSPATPPKGRAAPEEQPPAALERAVPPDEAGRRQVHVGVLLENVPEYVFWLAGAALAGAVVVGINPTRRGAELSADIEHTDCDLIVTDAELAGLLGEQAVPVLIVGSDSYASALEAVPPGEPAVPAPEDRLLLLFTSGSTGAPKAVSCSQGRLAMIAEMAHAFGIGRDAVTYLAMPLFHGNAIMANLAFAVQAGATVVLRRKFSASGFLPDVRRYGVTYFNYVGRALAYILATGDAGESTLRTAFGTEASAQDMAAFAERFGCQVVEGYGSSEGAVAIMKTPETPKDSLGLAQHGIDVVILDPETGAECPRARFDGRGLLLNSEAIGEIVGLNTRFEGYYRNAEADAQRLRNGRYWSGDLGYRDEDGFFYFAGRSSDWLRVDSENFAAAPVERILARWEPVVMCAVYPVPDPRTGDQVMATLELDGDFDPAGFAAFLEDQPDLGTKWAPRFIRITKEMPLTPTNKVDKKPLRKQVWETADQVWWRPGRELAYEPFEGSAALRQEFATHGRLNLLA